MRFFTIIEQKTKNPCDSKDYLVDGKSFMTADQMQCVDMLCRLIEAFPEREYRMKHLTYEQIEKGGNQEYTKYIAGIAMFITLFPSDLPVIDEERQPAYGSYVNTLKHFA